MLLFAYTFAIFSLKYLFLIAASAIPGGSYSAPNFFLQYKEFELYWGAVFFKDLFTHFHDF